MTEWFQQRTQASWPKVLMGCPILTQPRWWHTHVPTDRPVAAMQHQYIAEAVVAYQ